MERRGRDSFSPLDATQATTTISATTADTGRSCDSLVNRGSLRSFGNIWHPFQPSFSTRKSLHPRRGPPPSGPGGLDRANVESSHFVHSVGPFDRKTRSYLSCKSGGIPLPRCCRMPMSIPDSPTYPRSQTHHRQRSGHDRALHPYPTRNPTRTDRSGSSALAEIA